MAFDASVPEKSRRTMRNTLMLLVPSILTQAPLIACGWGERKKRVFVQMIFNLKAQKPSFSFTVKINAGSLSKA